MYSRRLTEEARAERWSTESVVFVIFESSVSVFMENGKRSEGRRDEYERKGLGKIKSTGKRNR